ncbi:MAG: PD-(D/E)XK nuclease family protein [Treponema sp.]|nr:PD-(D/E)XK nuclease family protein [Treponema sp.]
MKNLQIEEALKKYIHNQNAIFVFPTQVAADLWADRATLISGVSAVAMERFIAWDDFKGSSIKSQQQTKKSIPSAMRSIFALHILQENASRPFLHYIVADRYASEAEGFADRIAGLLPSLAQWKKHFEDSCLTADEEDKDLLELYNRYKDFLDANNRFDPAWETPPFYSNGNAYIIFYPEILMDWLEYKSILESSPDIHLIHLDAKESAQPHVSLFQNSRAELRSVAQYIRKMHDERHVRWTDMSINIPDIQTYGQYIERELSLYEIPYVMKNGQPLSSFGAGSFFDLAQQCISQDFSFDSIRKLLLNTDLPWKEPKLNEEIIQFGRDNNCLCSYNYNGKEIDVWQQAFETRPSEELLKTYYETLKKTLKTFVSSKSFAKIRENYFSFREKFFDMSLCSEQADLIISRCITELGSLIDLENEFPNCALHSPFNFFTNYLSQKMYLAQKKDKGVQILPYRLAATAPFQVQAVIDSSQASLSIQYKQLSFLRDDKRQKLGFASDPNVSDLFIRLYSMSAQEDILFTCSSKTFKGYSLSHSYFIEDKTDASKDDPYSKEKDWFLEKTEHAENDEAFPSILYKLQNQGFSFWQQVQGSNSELNEESISLIQQCINNKIYDGKKIKVSSTDLRSFFSCPRAWVFEKVLRLKQQNNEAELMDTFAMGNLYHKIMELYCMELKKRSMKLSTTEEGLSEECRKILYDSIDKGIDKQHISHLGKQLMLTTRQAIIQTMLNTVHRFSEAFNGCEISEVESNYDYAPEGKDYACTGRIDCLLKNPDEAEYILVDFKSTKGAIHKDIFYVSDQVDIPDFQMPMYLYLMENAEKNRRKTVENCAFFDIKDAEVVPVTGSLVMKKEGIDFEPTRQRVIDLIDLYCKKIKSYDFSVNEQNQDFSTCQSCAYKSVCRRTFTVSKEQAKKGEFHE